MQFPQDFLNSYWTLCVVHQVPHHDRPEEFQLCALVDHASEPLTQKLTLWNAGIARPYDDHAPSNTGDDDITFRRHRADENLPWSDWAAST
jgi:hypothetical protein